MDNRSSGEPAAARSRGPLDGLRVAAGSWPAAQLAGRLLALLGADVEPGPAHPGDLRSGQIAVRATADSGPGDWARSGLAELTGRPGGPGLVPAGAPATFAAACALGIELLTALDGQPVAVDWAEALSGRARLLGLARGGDVSAGGGTRLLRTSDGWCALSLPRVEDREMVLALTAGAVRGPDAGAGPGSGAAGWWAPLRSWSLTVTAAEVEDRAGLLGLAAGRVRRPEETGPRPPWSVSAPGTPAGPEPSPAPGTPKPAPAPAAPLTRPGPGQPLVVNLGSLWAAPLCAHLLGAAGGRVVDVESPGRPDGSRRGTPAFYQRLHAGHELAVLPLPTEEGHRQLAALLSRADVIITGSRTVSLTRLGATRGQVAARRPQVWVSVTGHGQESNRIGFGDDAAAAAGLVAWDEHGPAFAGDAIADPLTGLAAALCAFACLAGGGSWDARLALRDVAAASVRFP